MGWASYIEDKIKRLESDLQDTFSFWSENDESYAQIEKRIQTIVEAGKNCLHELLTLASDPNIKMADRVRMLEQENHRLEEANASLHSRHATETALINRLQIDLKETKQKMKDPQKTNQDLQSQSVGVLSEMMPDVRRMR